MPPYFQRYSWAVSKGRRAQGRCCTRLVKVCLEVTAMSWAEEEEQLRRPKAVPKDGCPQGTFSLLLPFPVGKKGPDGVERRGLWHVDSHHVLKGLQGDVAQTQSLFTFYINSICYNKPFASQLRQQPSLERRWFSIAYLQPDTNRICYNISLETIPVSEHLSTQAPHVHQRDTALTGIIWDRNQMLQFK